LQLHFTFNNYTEIEQKHEKTVNTGNATCGSFDQSSAKYSNKYSVRVIWMVY